MDDDLDPQAQVAAAYRDGVGDVNRVLVGLLHEYEVDDDGTDDVFPEKLLLAHLRQKLTAFMSDNAAVEFINKEKDHDTQI